MNNKTPIKNRNGRNKSYHSSTILNKAKIILLKENAIQEINGELFLVRSQTGNGYYRVEWNGARWICNCPDFIKNCHIRPCKHVMALELCFDYKFNKIDEKELKPDKITYSQDWPKYNKAKVMEFEVFDKFLYLLVSLIEEPAQHMGRPRHKLSDMIFCCIMKTYARLPSREAKYVYSEALKRQQISDKIHYNAISRTLMKKELTPLLYELVRQSAVPVAPIEVGTAVDSSGFRCSTFGAYCEEKHEIKRSRNWLKAHFSTGVYTHIVADVIITDENAADSPQFKKLIRNTAKNFDINEVFADMAYSSRENYEIVDKYGGTAYIPFRKNARGTARGSPLWRRAYYYFQLRREEFMKHYHKRSNAEATIAAIKKKFGETIRSKNRVAQENELLCKIIAYNLTVVIREMTELDCLSDFLSLNGFKEEQQ